MKRTYPYILFVVITVLLSVSKANAQSGGYQLPSDEIAQLVDAKLLPNTVLSPDKKWLALLERNRVLSLAHLQKPEKALAGIKFNPQTYMRTSGRTYNSIELKHVDTGSVVNITGLPQGILRNIKWSPDSKYVSFILEQESQSNLWLFDVQKRSVKQLTQSTLNGVVTRQPYQWLPDSTGLVVNIAVNHGKPVIEKKQLASGPVVQQSNGEVAPVRTYQNLLSSPDDEAQFKFYAQGQLIKLSLNGSAKMIGQATFVKHFAVSPDSTNIIVAMLDMPFSYQVPYQRFPAVWQVWGMTGHPLYELARQPLADNISQGFDSVRTGPREFQWRSDKGATVLWAEAQDQGNMKNDVEYHDHLYTVSAPFRKPVKLFAKLEWRFSDIEWANDNLAVLSEWRFSDRQVRQSIISARNADERRVVFSQRSYNDAYKNPGRFVKEYNDLGVRALKVVGGRYLFLTGNGASVQGNQPFLDRFDAKTNSTTRLWQSQAPYYERVRAVLDDEGTRFISLRESQQEQPNFFIHDLTFNTLEQLTRYPHPYPELQGVQKEQIKYRRSDGVELTANLYLPKSYDVTQGPLPVLMWAYPLEYKDKKVASQVRESPYAFSYFGYWGPLPYLAKGIAVLDDPTMPIVGEGDKLPNDSFRTQLVSSAKAAVDALVSKGVADPARIAIAGHSYGAFMVANLLAHSDLFVAGIARSGAYNRSLTPFGFQGEERSFWQAQDVYANMSPFFHAEKINEPMLMIHGEEDPNSGTYPMQSQRMYSALKGLGKQARLVMLPHEGHGYKARESIMHVLWEQEQWLQKYLFPQEEVLEAQEPELVEGIQALDEVTQ